MAGPAPARWRAAKPRLSARCRGPYLPAGPGGASPATLCSGSPLRDGQEGAADRPPEALVGGLPRRARPERGSRAPPFVMYGNSYGPLTRRGPLSRCFCLLYVRPDAPAGPCGGGRAAPPEPPRPHPPRMWVGTPDPGSLHTARGDEAPARSPARSLCRHPGLERPAPPDHGTARRAFQSPAAARAASRRPAGAPEPGARAENPGLVAGRRTPLAATAHSLRGVSSLCRSPRLALSGARRARRDHLAGN